jgi:N utilization substance protein A
MNRELLLLVDAISREKSVEREVVFGAVESALAQATKKFHGVPTGRHPRRHRS